MRSIIAGSALLTLIASQAFAANWSNQIVGDVRDTSGKSIADVSFVIDGKEYFGDKNGHFEIPARESSSSLLVKKAGFKKVTLQPQGGSIAVELEPQIINAIYVPWGELQNNASLQNVLNLIDTTELNAVVVDVKGDGGDVHTKLQAGVSFLHDHGIYVIGRVTSFKDTKYTRAHPELGLQAVHGGLWTDKKGNSYLNPYNDGAQDYVISVAKMGASQGLDEIQFDYVRFPTDGNIRRHLPGGQLDPGAIAFSEPDDAQHRTDAIARFAERARAVLGPMGVFVAADLFGIAGYEKNDLSAEGQSVEKLSAHLDYLCPMVYPSGYGNKDFYGIGIPDDHPEEIVNDSVKRYRMRADDDAVVRPWLQVFPRLRVRPQRVRR